MQPVHATILFCSLSIQLSFAACGLFKAGVSEGTSQLPYLVSSYEDLRLVGKAGLTDPKTSQLYNGCPLSAWYRQTQDIDAEASLYEYKRPAGESPAWNGFLPIGTSETTPFSGTYDGNGYGIWKLTIMRPSEANIGLFGYLTGTVKNLGIINQYMDGRENVGGLVGLVDLTGRVDRSYVEAEFGSGLPISVYGKGNVGGLVGALAGKITNSYATDQYVVARASENPYVGGTGAGGFVGLKYSPGGTQNCYSMPYLVAGASNLIGGFIGARSSGDLSLLVSPFWANDGMTNVGILFDGYWKSTEADMAKQSTFTNEGWDFGQVWTMSATRPLLRKPTRILAQGEQFAANHFTSASDLIATLLQNDSYAGTGTLLVEILSTTGGLWSAADGFTFNTTTKGATATIQYRVNVNTGSTTYFGAPVTATLNQSCTLLGKGTQASPLLVTSYQDLLQVGAGCPLNFHYEQTANIDASATSAGPNFNPIGSNPQNNTISPFAGVYNGSGFRIQGLTIDSPTFASAGLFASVTGQIMNVGLEYTSFHGKNKAGGLVGVLHGSLSQSYVSGPISGAEIVGGLVGQNEGSILNSYSIGNVDGLDTVAGLVGKNNGSLVNSYSKTNVSCTGLSGALVAKQGPAGTTEASFWNSKASGKSQSAAGSELSDQQMTSIIHYSNWDFVSSLTSGIWDIHPSKNNGTPFLSWQYIRLGSTGEAEVTNQKIYDGSTETQVKVDPIQLHGVQAGDIVQLVGSAHFEKPTPGNNLAIHMEYSLSGKNSGNYVLPFLETSFLGSIDKRPIQLAGFTNANKTYDGTKAATLNGAHLENEITGEDVSLGVYEFVSKDAGTGIKIQAIGPALLGKDTANYHFAPLANITGDIAPYSISVIANPITKKYGESSPDLTYSALALLDGDKWTGSLERTPGDKPGIYAIELGTLTAGPNYSIQYTGADFTILKNPTTAIGILAAKGKGRSASIFLPTDGSVVIEFVTARGEIKGEMQFGRMEKGSHQMSIAPELLGLGTSFAILKRNGKAIASCRIP